VQHQSMQRLLLVEDCATDPGRKLKGRCI